MNVSQSRRTRVFNILTMIWASLFIATVLFFPVIAVVHPAPDLLRSTFIILGTTMLSLAFLITILLKCFAVSLPRTPAPEHWS